MKKMIRVGGAIQLLTESNLTGYNSTYPKGGVSCSKDSFVVNQTLVFQIKFCGKNPAPSGSCERLVVSLKTKI